MATGRDFDCRSIWPGHGRGGAVPCSFAASGFAQPAVLFDTTAWLRQAVFCRHGLSLQWVLSPLKASEADDRKASVREYDAQCRQLILQAQSAAQSVVAPSLLHRIGAALLGPSWVMAARLVSRAPGLAVRAHITIFSLDPGLRFFQQALAYHREVWFIHLMDIMFQTYGGRHEADVGLR